MFGRRRRIITNVAALYGSAAPTLLLDSLSATPFAAFSTRKLRAAYAGSALKVTTSAAGNATQNIGFNGTNDLDTAALASFIGSNSASVATLYDQANSNDLSQATVSRQPIITNSGVNDTQHGRVWFGGLTANSTYLESGAISLAQPYTAAGVFRFDDTAVNESVFNDGSTLAAPFISGASRYAMLANSFLSAPASPAPDTSLHSFICIANGSSSQLIVDNASLVTGNAGATILGQIILWGTIANAVANAHIAEAMLFSGAISSTDQTTLHSSWQTYWGAP